MRVNAPTAVSVGAVVLVLFWLRHCSLITWICVIGVPAVLYAVFAEQTKATKVSDCKLALVTGASSGLGKALALELARRGCKTLILVARTESKLKETATECKTVGTHGSFTAVPLRCDLTSLEEVKKMAELVTKDYGAIDLLVNNAGAGEWKWIEESTPEDGEAMMACPYQTAFACSCLFVPAMAKAQTGHILNVASAACSIGFRGAVGYGAARWAVRGLSKNLYWDLKELGIGVTLLNAAEITGTDYFKDTPGKAGSSSHAKIPSLFQLVDKLGINYNTHQVAAAAVTAVEKGWTSVNVPWYLLQPTVVLNCCVPWFVEFLVSLGSAGIRGKTKKE